jgi:hypothetical protein
MSFHKIPARAPRPFCNPTPTDAFELVSGWIPVSDDQIISVEPIAEADEHTRPTVPNIDMATGYGDSLGKIR